jgi:hypothetical protein
MKSSRDSSRGQQDKLDGFRLAPLASATTNGQDAGEVSMTIPGPPTPCHESFLQESRPMQFDHIGIVTTEKKADEMFVPATRVWVTDFQTHPQHIEWLRFEPDSPVTGKVREMPHVAYRVDSIQEAAKGMKVLLEPFDAGIAVVGFFETPDGGVVEFMEYPKTKE